MANADPHPEESAQTVKSGAYSALALLFAINLFNYIDRQVLSAVLPYLQIDASLFRPGDPNLKFKLGLLTSAFLVSYTLLSPVFGWFGNMGRRWFVIGIGVCIWSLASGGSGLAISYGMLLLTRCLVGIGEAAYGPIAPSMISDLFPLKVRGRVMAYFYVAIPVGSALGFVIGGAIAEEYGWRAAFYVTVSGLILGMLCLSRKEPPMAQSSINEHKPTYFEVLRELRGIPSFVLCCLGMTCTTFVLGGVAAWAPTYIFQREAQFSVTDKTLNELRKLENTEDERLVPDEQIAKLEPLKNGEVYTFDTFNKQLSDRYTQQELETYGQEIYRFGPLEGSTKLGDVTFNFGVIVVISGLGATLLGGWVGDKLRNKGVRGAYFHTAGWTTIIAWPCFVAMLYIPFPLAWLALFPAVFFLFFNTGPANTILANVTRSPIRATAFAINILIIHMLGDVISPPIIGRIADVASLKLGLLVTSFMIPVGGTLWVIGSRFLDADTTRAESPASAGAAEPTELA